MKRKFSLNKGQRRGIGQAIAASVMVLALTLSGAGATALLISQPTGLVVEPSSAQTSQYSAKDSDDERAEHKTDSKQDTTEEKSAERAEDTAEESASEQTVTITVTETAQPQQAAEAEAPTENAEDNAAAQTQTAKPDEGTNIDEENSFAHFVQETPELAAEDPLAAPDETNDTAQEAARSMEDNPVLLTPEQIEQALSEGALDEAAQYNLTEENCLDWLWNWLFGSLFPSEPVQPEYSGWRTDDSGNTYYYDPATHEALTGIHTIDGVLYYFNANGVKQDVTFGIDVSKYQSNIDWQQVKTSGVQFVIIRVGYRGYVSGTLVLDPMFEEHFTNARNAGLRVGVYALSQAVTEDEAREEAMACVYVLNGRSLDYPIYFDSEASGSSNGSGRADGLGVEDRTKCAVAFCEQVKALGYRPGVYASTRWFEKRLNLSALTGYSIWNAHYDVIQSGIACEMWQGSCQGRVNGYGGNIDIDISYIG